jgi:hypothetical protein
MSVNGVLQLEKLVLSFCKASGASAGVRASLAAPAGVARFALENASVAVSAEVAPSRAPRAIAHYRDGTRREIDLKNRGAAAVGAVLRKLRDSATGARRSFRKPVATHVPSVQGVWDPSITYKGFELRDGKP